MQLKLLNLSTLVQATGCQKIIVKISFLSCSNETIPKYETMCYGLNLYRTEGHLNREEYKYSLSDINWIHTSDIVQNFLFLYTYASPAVADLSGRL